MVLWLRCVYSFSLHQPYRLRRHSVFDAEPVYFDEGQTEPACRWVVRECYVPATRLMLESVRRYVGRFKLCYSVSGVLPDQLERSGPRVIHLFGELSATERAAAERDVLALAEFFAFAKGIFE